MVLCRDKIQIWILIWHLLTFVSVEIMNLWMNNQKVFYNLSETNISLGKANFLALHQGKGKKFLIEELLISLIMSKVMMILDKFYH